MSSTARALLCLVLLLGTGCSRALRFNFGFSAEDGGQAQHDAAAGHDLSAPVDMVKPIDQSISMSDLAPPDLAVGGDDLLSRPDLFSSPDMLPVSDLKKTMDLSNDLPTSDMLPQLSPLGGPCTKSEDCAGGAACLTYFKFGTTAYELPGGYCSFPCSVTGTDTLCISLGGHCSPGTVDTSICVRNCSTDCPTARNKNSVAYGCCSYQASPSGATIDVGCMPMTLDPTTEFTCMVP